MTGLVSAFSWNPRRGLNLPLLRRVRIGPRTNNFGDLLGPMIVGQMRERLRLDELSQDGTPRTLFSVGSVLHFAVDGDVVWGSGVNGKVPRDAHKWSEIDVRAVRGQLTRRWLSDNRGIEAPEVFGDPALLLFELGYPRPERRESRGLTFIPNLNDRTRVAGRGRSVSPRQSVRSVLSAIAQSEAVVTSSLHALLFAELLGVPVALLKTPAEPAFKYLDYASGTGRDELPMFEDFASASAHATSASARREAPLDGWSPVPLMRAFPADIFGKE